MRFIDCEHRGRAPGVHPRAARAHARAAPDRQPAQLPPLHNAPLCMKFLLSTLAALAALAAPAAQANALAPEMAKAARRRRRSPRARRSARSKSSPPTRRARGQVRRRRSSSSPPCSLPAIAPMSPASPSSRSRTPSPQLSPRGQLTPLRNGAGALRAEIGGQTAIRPRGGHRSAKHSSRSISSAT